MDIKVSKPSKRNSLSWYIAIALLLVGFAYGGFYVWQLGQAEVSLDANSVTIGRVTRGDLDITVRGNGILAPENVQWMAASSEAKVKRLVLKAGNHVKQGDLIIELENPELSQALAEAQWELSALEAEHKAQQVVLNSQIKQQQSTLKNELLSLQAAQQEFTAHQELIDTGAVSKLDYQRAEITLKQREQAVIFAKQLLAENKQNNKALQQARYARLEQTKKRVARIQHQVDQLQVKASIDSVVLAVPVEVGQHVNMGTNLAKLADKKDLIAELQVPEIQIQRVQTGQQVKIDTQTTIIEGVVARIDPAVIQGNVQVDIALTSAIPSEARPDLSVDGEIQIAKLTNVLYVERPVFSQGNSNAGLYQLTNSGQFANRTQVEIGMASVRHIEIINGLNEGDLIITSDPTRFESYQTIKIN